MTAEGLTMLKKKNSLPNMETVVPFPVSDVLHITRPDMEELLVWRQQNHEIKNRNAPVAKPERKEHHNKDQNCKEKGQEKCIKGKKTTDITNTKANSYEEIQKLEMQNKVE